MSGDRILDAEEVIALLPTQAALIRLGKSHELLRERLRTAETENERLSAGFGVAQAGWENAEGRVAALTQALATLRALIVPMDNAPDTVDPILAKVMVEIIDKALARAVLGGSEHEE